MLKPDRGSSVIFHLMLVLVRYPTIVVTRLHKENIEKSQQPREIKFPDDSFSISLQGVKRDGW